VPFDPSLCKCSIERSAELPSHTEQFVRDAAIENIRLFHPLYRGVFRMELRALVGYPRTAMRNVLQPIDPESAILNGLEARASPSSRLPLVEEGGQLRAKSLANVPQCHDGRIPLTELAAAYIGAIDVHPFNGLGLQNAGADGEGAV
jgi:hypothetical protein